ncbi:hypothetical protein V2A60_000175 [Cordyceps javanica]
MTTTGGLAQVCQKIFWPTRSSPAPLKAKVQKLPTPADTPKAKVKKPPPTEADAVFFGDFRWPAEAKKEGGFLPLPPDLETELASDGRHYVDTWTVPILRTWSTFGSAAQAAALEANRSTPGFHGVVYLVHSTPNIFVSNSGKSWAVGGIRWSQVIGWVQIPLDYNLPKQKPWNTAELQHAALKDSTRLEGGSIFQNNPDYEPTFDKFTLTRDNIPDITSMGALGLFMESYGHAVGWSGSFPLFKSKQPTTASSSRHAKARNGIAPPHTSTHWGPVSEFFRNNVAGICFMTVVPFLVTLLPFAGLALGLGEAAAIGATAAVEGATAAVAGATESFELAEFAAEAGEAAEGVAEEAEEATERTPLLRPAGKLKVE